ncbi:MAG TPA: alpha-mannosidase [Blastocatellia bacterium]|nr:alpha-mannosidase [Blastocatellia bacterium]
MNVLNRLDAMTSLPVTEWRYHVADIPHPEDVGLDDSNWTAVTFGRNGNQSGSNDSPGWYRTWIEIPSMVGGKDIRGARVHLALRVASLARVFFNGSMVATGEGRLLLPILVTEKAVPGQRILVAVSTSRLSDARLSIDYPGQPDPGVLRREIQTAVAIMAGFPKGNSEREKQLDTVVNAIDVTALDRGDQQGFVHSLEEANLALKPISAWMKQFSIKAVGNSHIDMAWLWPWTETVEVVRNTYTTALQLMREYPDFTYAQSSAQTFSWLEEKYPDIFRQIQQRVKEGRWEIVGGMWVEPDLNMPDGESIVRQLLVGKRYFKKKFDVDVNIGWNPDSFGYNWQLPQIYKKSGIDYFVTQKMSWNETTVFPHKLFWWQSPDGSRVLTFFPHGYDNGADAVRMGGDIATYAPQTKFPEVMHLYGVGDHGGGPTREMLDELVRLRDPATAFPQISFSTAHSFFADIQKNLQNGSLNPPVWNDELYLEYHRGCYTTQSETKKLIRQNEELLQNAEKFAAFSYLNLRTYPHEQFEESWRKLLFDHFHDIMPGSGIAVNYLDAARNLGEVSSQGEKILNGALGELSSRIDTHGSGAPIVVYNPLSWDRTGSVIVEAQLPEPLQLLEAFDSRGQLVPLQIISTEAATGKVKARILARNVPALGYEVIHLVSTHTGVEPVTQLKVNGTTLENEFLIVKIDPTTGCITSLINKADGKETLSPGSCGNLLQTFVDKPLRQDAWEIRFDQQSWDLKQPQEVTLVENGPVRAVVRIKHKFQNSTFVQNVCLYAGVPRIEVETQVDWHEQHILLKAGIQPNVKTDFATYEIPYGTIQRPTTRNTPAEEAKFEVPAIRWGDLSDGNHGISLLNASKYGYDAKGNVIRLSLLRAATYPSNGGECCTDQGLHEFTYGLYPHTGNWESGGTMQQGYELNYPLIAVTTTPHAGPLPTRYSFASIEPRNVIMTVVKKAEDDDALIFRFYEFAGRQTQVKIQLPDKAASALETNLMEKQGRPLTLGSNGREITVQTGPYEIKTVEVMFEGKKP